jgi:hypothetical protein
MHASTSHVNGAKDIIDSGTASCNIDRWNFTDLVDKGRPNSAGYPIRIVVTVNPSHSNSFRGGAMNVGSVFAITRRMACSSGLVECVLTVKCVFDKKLYSFETCF